MNQDEFAIRKVIETWLRASAAGDHETVLSLMADDVVFLVPGHEPFGKEAFAPSQENHNQFDFQAKSEVREIRVIGDWAYTWTHLTVTISVKNGSSPVTRSGNVLSIFQRLSDGRWVLFRDANLMTVVKSA